MTNTLVQAFDPDIFSLLAIEQLFAQFNTAKYCFMGYSKKPSERGSKVVIPIPSYIQGGDAPLTTIGDLKTSQVEIPIDFHKEAAFQVTDRELNYSQQMLIDLHIRPSMKKIAQMLDDYVLSFAKKIPWFYNASANGEVKDLTKLAQVLNQNNVPKEDRNLMVDSTMEANFLGLEAFSQQQGAGDLGIQTQTTGNLGRKFGFNIFSNNNAKSHTAGTASTPNLLLNGAVLEGATTINLDAGTVTGTLEPGDSFVIAGNTQRYVVTNSVTASGNAFTGVQIYPALVDDYADNSAVTFSLLDHTENIAFTKEWLAIAFAPLSTMGAEFSGAKIGSAYSEETGLTVRTRIYYDPAKMITVVSFDVLAGVQILDPNKAVKLRYAL